MKTPNFLKTLLSAKSISSAMQDILLQMLKEMEKKAKGALGKGKRVVQSRDQAHMNLVLVQPCNSGQCL